MRYRAFVSRVPSRLRASASSDATCPSTGDGERRLRGDDGALIIECAFVLPVFFIFVFLVIEGSLLFSNWQTINNGLLAASRTATVYGNDNLTDYQALLNFKKNFIAVNLNQLQGIAIFKATSATGAVPASCKVPPGQVGVCNTYTAADLKLIPSTPTTLYFGTCTANTVGGGKDQYWCPVTRKTAVSGSFGPPDYVGVWAKVRHQQPTRMFGSFKDIEQTIVVKIEPHDLT